MKKIIYKTLITLLFLISFNSCDVIEDSVIGSTLVVEMSGDWYVKLLLNDVDKGGGFQKISTYNTASDDGKELWIDDRGHLWQFKAKAIANTDNLTFSGNDLASNYDGYEITVTITNGKVTKGDVITEEGNPTDGISFDIVFSDDPNNTYNVIGYKRTGFAEDEH